MEDKEENKKDIKEEEPKKLNFSIKNLTLKNSGYFTLWGLIFFFSGISVLCFSIMKGLSAFCWNIIKNMEEKKNKKKNPEQTDKKSKNRNIYIRV